MGSAGRANFLASGELRVLVPLADIFPKPYTAVVLWATDDLIQQDPELVRAFVDATLETVRYVKEHPGDAADLVFRRTKAPKAIADKVCGSSYGSVVTRSARS